jgi:hypothetical protein
MAVFQLLYLDENDDFVEQAYTVFISSSYLDAISKAGLYNALFDPDKYVMPEINRLAQAKDITKIFNKRLKWLAKNKHKFVKLIEEGSVDELIELLNGYYNACKAHPEANIYIDL